MAVQLRNDELIELLRGDYQARYEPNFAWKSAASVLRGLPGLRGAWTMGSFDENGDQFDISGQARTLTRQGSAVYGYDDLVPYVNFTPGTFDYLSRGDEAGLDILGTEGYVVGAVQGLTMGLWFQPDRLTAQEWLIAKGTGAAAVSSYWLMFRGDLANDPVRFAVSDGAANDTVDLNNAVTSTSNWYFVAARYEPSTEIKVWVGSQGTLQSNTNVAGIPAALNNSGSALTIGANATPANYLDGRVSMAWLCCEYLSDAIVATIWEQTRAMFGE